MEKEKINYALELIENELDVIKRFKPAKHLSPIEVIDRLDSFEFAKEAIEGWKEKKEYIVLLENTIRILRKPYDDGTRKE